MADWEYTVTAAAKGALRNGVQRPYFDVWKCVVYAHQVLMLFCINLTI